MTIYKKIPIAKEYEMSVDGHIRRKDGLECDLTIDKERNKVYLPNLKNEVDLKWLTYITHFEVDLSLSIITRIRFENSFKCFASNVFSVRMFLPNLPLINGKYKIIPEFTRYAVSKEGVVLDTYSGDIVPLVYETNRYITVNIYDPDKYKYKNALLHRLVALAWIPIVDPMRQYIVNHKDGNKHNPHADNLEWTSFRGNTLHAYENQLGYMFSCNVKDFKDGKIHKFSSIKDACIFMNIKQRAQRDFNSHTLINNRYQIKLDVDKTEWKTENKFPGHIKGRPIQAFNILTKKITDYPSMREASRQLNIWFATIRGLVIAGEEFTCKDYCFRYTPESITDRKKWTTNIREHIRAPKRILGTNRVTKEVKEFNSASEAETSTGISRKAVVRSLKGKPTNKEWSFRHYWEI